MALTGQELDAILAENFAPWVQDLALSTLEATDDHVIVRMSPSERLNRVGDIVCGQAMMAAADTVMVLALASAAGKLVPAPTVDMTTSFLRPAPGGEDLLVRADLVRLGRTMCFVRAELSGEQSGKLVATATATYLIPPG